VAIAWIESVDVYQQMTGGKGRAACALSAPLQRLQSRDCSATILEYYLENYLFAFYCAFYCALYCAFTLLFIVPFILSLRYAFDYLLAKPYSNVAILFKQISVRLDT
jgi:hypothetical protein